MHQAFRYAIGHLKHHWAPLTAISSSKGRWLPWRLCCGQQNSRLSQYWAVCLLPIPHYFQKSYMWHKSDDLHSKYLPGSILHKGWATKVGADICTVKIKSNMTLISPTVQIFTPRSSSIFTPSQVMVLRQEIQTEVQRAMLKRSESKAFDYSFNLLFMRNLYSSLQCSSKLPELW